jgi:hypothetical protein
MGAVLLAVSGDAIGYGGFDAVRKAVLESPAYISVNRVCNFCDIFCDLFSKKKSQKKSHSHILLDAGVDVGISLTMYQISKSTHEQELSPIGEFGVVTTWVGFALMVIGIVWHTWMQQRP